MIEIKKIGDKGYCFSLKTSEGNTLFDSVHFPSEKAIRKTVAELNPLMERQGVFERKTDHDGKFLFNLKDGNGKLIGKSLRYSSEAGMENGIKNLKSRIASLEAKNNL